MISSMRRRPIVIAVLMVALAACAGAGYAAGVADREPVERHALGATNHVVGVKHRTLGLQRTVIRPGAEIPLHHHEGTQVAYIDQGAIYYTVVSGEVTVRKGSGDDPTAVRKISAGETGKLKAGQWIVEQPSDIHQATNRGQRKAVVLQATLLEQGAPAATPD
jgi:quercetin dioxygenase-like cupin family protein